MTNGNLDIGTELAGYRIDGLLGRGGMGFVYAAEHVLLGRKAAIKTLLPELAGDGDFKERFIRESRVVASIDHPNIIPIYDAGEAAGVAYIAMRFVQGADLSDLIERQGGLSAERTVAILDQAGGALDAAHAHEIVHRDVKPANVLIDEPTGRVFLTDFGIAKAARTRGLTRTGYFIGTLDYASPQQIQGQALGPAADIYSLGCVLYECLTGSKPFPKETDVAVFHAQLLEPPPKVTDLKPDLPAAFDDVVARAMAKAEEERFTSCRELVDAARAALTGGGAAVRATQPSPAAAAPRPSGARLLASNLPAVATPLVGREREVNAVSELLRRPDVRLVTLMGVGGTGKTRLSLELGATLGPEFGNVLFVDLAPVSDPALVGNAIAEALGVGEARDMPLLETIRSRIGDDPMLLLLDNFEQVVEAASFVADLLAAAPTLTVLVTSQASLRIRGEHEFPVPPLSLPDPADADVGAMAESAAVALFVERAQAVRPQFELTDENAAAVAEICVRLDGLPLAIELAAARVKLLSPQAMLARLERRFDLLTGGAVDLPERQQTLRNAIDWSYDLLNDAEKSMFSRLGVFVGGSALEAAEGVCGSPDGLGIGEVIDLLASLVDKSLVRQLEGSDGEPRFNMLETIREYALTRLEERGELEDLQRRHAERFLALAEAAEPELVRASQATWLQRLDEENANIRAALAWSLRSDDRVELGLRMAGALVRFWSTRGHMTEGRRWLTEALERAKDIPAPVLAKAYYAAGYSALGQGDYVQAKPFFEQSLELSRTAGDVRLEAASLQQLGFLVMARGEYVDDAEERAGQLAEKSLELARTVGDKLTASGALNILADRASAGGRNTEAMELFEEGLALRRELGDKRLVANSLVNLGRTELTRGQYDRATELFEEALAVARDVRDTWSMSVALVNLGRVRLHEDSPDDATKLFLDALKIAKDRGDKRVAAECLQGLGAASAAGDDPERAARLFAAADAMLESIGAMASPAERLIDERFGTQLRDKLGEDAWETQRAAGARLSAEDAVALGLSAAG